MSGSIKKEINKIFKFYEKILPAIDSGKINELENKLSAFLDIINKFEFLPSQLEFLNEEELDTDECDKY